MKFQAHMSKLSYEHETNDGLNQNKMIKRQNLNTKHILLSKFPLNHHSFRISNVSNLQNMGLKLHTQLDKTCNLS